MTLQRTYNLVLRLYPREYRALFGAEMSAAFDEAARDRRRTGLAAPGFVFREITGLMLTAAHEWIAKIAYSVSHSVDYINGRCQPDRLLMRAPGVGWKEHYACREDGAAADPSADRDAAGGWSGLDSADCVNAYQTFALASPFRRLVILIVGSGKCRHCL